MSDIEPVLQQNSEVPDIVNKEEFTIELRNYYNGHNLNSKKLEWTSKRIQNVIKLLDEYNIIKSQGRRATNKHYHHARKYDVMNNGNQKVLIMKKKNTLDHVVQIIPSEDYYQIIHDAHIATRHGRRDKVVQALKEKYSVPIFAVTIFLSLCKICLSKKSVPKKGNIVKPLISDDFNRRGQIDLVDFQTSPDKEYKWLMQYQDYLTKFCFLRPLKSKQAKEVAIEIIKIFLEVGCPNILQSDNGREFTESVLKEIISLWPAFKIANGRPSPYSQSIENSNHDVKNMIRAWMSDNKSTNWSFGCYFVQFQKNSSFHSAIGQTPYKALFGEEPKLGLSSTYLSNNIISKLVTEEDMEELCKEQNSEEPIHEFSSVFLSNNIICKLETEEEEEDQEINNFEQSNLAANPDLLPNLYNNSHNKQYNEQKNIFLGSQETLNSEISIVIEKQEEQNNALEVFEPNNTNVLPNEGNIDIFNEGINNFVCNICNKVVSGENQGYGSQLLCNLCVNRQESTQSHINLKRMAEKMLATSSKKIKDLGIDSSVFGEIQEVGQNVEKKNELYQVGTAFGIIKDWMLKNAAHPSPQAELLHNNPEVTLPLRSIESMSSSFDGQEMKQCNCKRNIRGHCVSKKCNCKKANVQCNSRCHSTLQCNNK